MRNKLVLCALEQQYPNCVSDKCVNSQFNCLCCQTGSSLASTLEQNGTTESAFCDQIRTTLTSVLALCDKQKPTTCQIAAQWCCYQPCIQVQHILVCTVHVPKQIISDYQMHPTECNFESLACCNSIALGTCNMRGCLAALANTDTSLDSTFKSAAFKLCCAGDILTTPVCTQTGTHVIRVISIAKMRQLCEHCCDLACQITTSWHAASTVKHGIILCDFKMPNVSICDKALMHVLSATLSTSSASSTSKLLANSVMHAGSAIIHSFKIMPNRFSLKSRNGSLFRFLLLV